MKRFTSIRGVYDREPPSPYMTTLELSTLHKLVKNWTEEAIAFRQKRDYQTSATLQSCALELQSAIEKLNQLPPDTTP